MRTVQLPEKMARRLSDFAAKRHSSELACLEEALEQFFLDEEGDERAAKIALARLEKKGPRVSLDEVRKELGLSQDD